MLEVSGAAAFPSGAFDRPGANHTSGAVRRIGAAFDG